MNRRLPCLLLLVGTLIFSVYPRFLPAGAPDALRGDFALGCAYGVAIGLELLALVMMRPGRRPMC